MILDGLAILGLGLAFLSGLFFPRATGWGVVATVLFLGPAQFTLVPSDNLPLTAYRFGAAVALGMTVRYSRRLRALGALSGSWMVRMLAVFATAVTLLSLDERAFFLMFTFLPNLLFPVLLGFHLIRSTKDLDRLTTIFAWHATLIGLFIGVEFFTSFDLTYVLLQTNPHADFTALQSQHATVITRSGFFRPAGIDGNSVQTGYRLTFLFPICLWYSLRGGLWRLIPAASTLLGILLLQTRAAWVGVALSVASLGLVLALFASDYLRRNIRIVTRLAFTGFVGLLAVGYFFPDVVGIAYTSFVQNLGPVLVGDLGIISEKVGRIPLALSFFTERPILGYGSPWYVYYEVMNAADIPAPLVYLLAGGIPLGLIYGLLLAILPSGMIAMARRPGLEVRDRYLLLFAFAAQLGGTVVLFSNWQERHMILMYLLYVGAYRVFCRPVPETSPWPEPIPIEPKPGS